MHFFPYIYEPKKSIDVYKQTEEYFISNPSIKNRIEELGWIYQTVGRVIPQNLVNYWSGHYFPFSESWDELQISFNLICFGFYKQAFVSLRSGLELGLLSIYYNINDEGHNIVRDWFKSSEMKEADTPTAKTIWNILLSHNNIKKFNDKHNLRESFNTLRYLHNYVHTKGVKHSNNMGIRGGNYQTFESTLIEQWLESYAAIVSLICTLHLLKYPIAVIRFDYRKKFGIDIPSFGGLEEFNIDRIAAILPQTYLSDIEQIAQEDPITQATIKEISEFPDLTEDQIEEQIDDMEKRFIEHGDGFIIWLQNQTKWYKPLEQDDFDQPVKDRIERLRKWAIEKNFLEPVQTRPGWGT